jgi:alcohol dehydrogenase class IV
VATVLTGNEDARAEDGVEWVEQLCAELDVPGLSAYGVERTHLPGLVDKAMQASSTKGNPLVLGQGEMLEVISAAL